MMSKENNQPLKTSRRNRKSSFIVYPIIGAMFLVVGLLYAGMFYEGITSAVVMILLVVGVRFFHLLFWKTPFGALLLTLFLLVPFAALIDLKGNFIYNRPAQAFVCKSDETLDTKVTQTNLKNRNRVIYSFGFYCEKDGEQSREVSSWTIYSIRLCEYFAIGLVIFIAWVIYDRFTRKEQWLPT